MEEEGPQMKTLRRLCKKKLRAPHIFSNCEHGITQKYCQIGDVCSNRVKGRINGFCKKQTKKLKKYMSPLNVDEFIRKLESELWQEVHNYHNPPVPVPLSPLVLPATLR